jgi:hypothetical protein
MASRRPGPGELLAGASGLLLLLAMFLPWFGVDASLTLPGAADPITVEGRGLDAWETFGAIDMVLAASAVLALTLAATSFFVAPPPVLAAAAGALAALAALLIVYRLIDVPDLAVEQSSGAAYETSRRLGAFFGLLCTAGIAWGANVALGGVEVEAEPEVAPAAPAPAPAPREPAPAAPAAPAPTTAAVPLGGWTRDAIEAECASAWRRYDRRLADRYTHYFDANPELRGDQRFSARDLSAALPVGWEELAGAIPEGAWHRQHLSGKSSQTLAVGLLGVAAQRDPSLAWLWEALAPLPAPAAEAPAIDFEHVVAPELLGERPRQTSIDVLIDDPSVVVAIETKWREHGVGACLCRGGGVGPAAGERCSRRVEQRDAYWDAAEALLGVAGREPGGPCPISPAYEAVRHAAAVRALAGPKRPAVLALLYDADNPYFASGEHWPGWPELLEEAAAAHADPAEFRFAAISWQELVGLMPLDDETRAWVAEKHGLA